MEVSKRGLSGLCDSWAALIAEHFLHETRFDPLHRAESEQLLYTRLPEWLNTLRDSAAAVLTLDVGARVYRVEISRQALVSAVAADYQALVARARGSAVDREIGRASCRERVCQYVEVSVVAGPLQNKKNKQ